MSIDAAPEQNGSAPTQVADRRANAIGMLTGVNALLLVQGLVVGSLQARALGPVGRGRLAAIVIPTTVAVPFITIGAFFATTYLIGRRTHSQRLVVGSMLVFTFGVGVVGALAGPVFSAWLLPSDPEARHLLTISLCMLPIATCNEVFYGYVVAIEGWRYAAVFKAIVPVAVILGTVLLYLDGAGTLSAFVYLNVGSLVASMIFLAVVGRPKGRLSVNLSVVGEGVRFGSKWWLFGIVGLANARLDQVWMAHFAAARELGLYAVAVSATAPMIPLSSAVGLVAYQRATHGASLDSLARASRVNVAAALLLAVPLAVAIPVGLPLLFGSAYWAAVPMALILLVAAVPIVAQGVLTAAATRIGKPGLPAASEGLAVLVTVGGLALFLRSYGGIGAALVSLAAYTTTVVGLAALVVRGTGNRPNDLLLPRGTDFATVVRSALALVVRSRRRLAGVAAKSTGLAAEMDESLVR